MSPTAEAVQVPYRLVEALGADDRFRLFRGRWGDDGRPVLVKLPLASPPSPADAAALRREYELLAGLPEEAIDAGVVRAHDFIAADGRCALLLADDGGVPLFAGAPLSLPQAVDCALGLAGALSALHRAGLVHRALAPQAVLFDAAGGRVRLADLALAARDSGEAAAPLPPAQYRTRLPYAAPELTGRVNRAGDYRSDFYSLGALLYEWLTGRRPFPGDDPLELIHSHIARLPPAPADIAPSVPLPLSQVVMKLLAKPAEERYQSAACLLRDLRRCRPAAPEAIVAPFAIGEGDVAERFAVPQRLYGREAELEALGAAYEQARRGANALLLVCGQPGVGKTALIRELHVPVARGSGHFVSGKFDQLSRDVPYGAIVQALRQLIGRRLTEPPEPLVRLRERLDAALGAHAAVIAEVVPEIELVLGPQPPVTRLPPAEERNRFTLAFQNFVAALASAESPLVVFLDDLQWVDAATLQLMAALAASPEVRHLLLIGAYRDNEVGEDHPLPRMAAALRADGVPVQRIALAPLEATALNRLAADTLHTSRERAAPLAGLLHAKTGGNPFFVIQFLTALHRERLIAFDAAAAEWRCRLEAISEAALSDDIIGLMSRRIDRLNPAARHLLTVAACLGNRFDAATLAAAAARPAEEVDAALAEAAAENLVIGESDGVYGFLHDRVQQAAYARVAAGERPQLHLAIGRRLWAQPSQAAAAAGGIFDIASHLNLGAPLIDSAAERRALARLNLVAGQRAKASAAFRTARGYFAAGASLLDEEDWRAAQPLAFELELETAQCEYLCGDFEPAQARLEALLARAADDLQRAGVHRLRLVQQENQARYGEALASARDGLRLFGVLLPESADEKQAALDAELRAIGERLGGRPIASLVDLPAIADPKVRMLMRILTDIWSSAYIVGDVTLARLISATLVRLSLAHGNAEESAYGYVTHAITAGPVQLDYEAAWQWGKLALQVNEKFGDLRLRAKIHQQFHAHVNLWRRPFRSCLAYAREACRSGLESGDFVYAAYGAATESWPAFEAAQDLEQFVRDCQPNLALVLRLKNEPFADVLRLMIGWALALQGRTDAPGSLACAEFDEARYAQAYRDNPFFSLFHAVARLHVACLLGDEAGAARQAAAARGTARRLIGMLWSVQFEFWNGLAAAARFDAGEAPGAQLDELRRAAGALSALAASCPENFLAPSLLLEGELARVGGEPLRAIERYEQAIAAAGRADMVQQQALAHELAGRFWLQRGLPRPAAPHLHAAVQLYSAWGAQAKVRRLIERHGAVLAAAPVDPPRAAPPPAGAATLDIATIGRAAQAIAANVELEALIAQMLQLAIENAGASSGVLIEERDGALLIAAESAGASAIVLPHGRALDNGPARCSRAVVRYVARTRQTVLVDDAARDERFAGDEHIETARPKSILCLPILQQGRLHSIFYLENTLVADAFSAERIEVIRILAAQAAASLRSGRLLQRMEQEVAERRRAEEQLRAIETGTAAVTGGDFFRALVRNLAQALRVRWAFVAECLPGNGGSRRVRSRAFWSGGEHGADFEYDAPGTPCQGVLDGAVCHYADDLPARFPADATLAEMGAQSYLGMPLLDSAGQVIGHMAVLDTQPMPHADTAIAVLRLSAGRAGAELERLKAEESLQQALAEIGELKNRLQAENVYLRRELIANVSHDLRSPLASLRGYLDTLLLKEDSLGAAERRRYLQIAVRQAGHLQSLIAQLFDLARLDFDGYQICAEPLHLGELARDVLQKFQLAAEHKQVSLQLQADGEVGFVRADIGLLERALENLLENALAHTPAGGRVRLALRPRDGRVEVEVSDSGCGIPAADLPHVFERFYRVDKARARDDTGSGLGLAIVRRIVELHGAVVHVDSRPDTGARFWFALPPLRVCTAQPAR